MTYSADGLLETFKDPRGNVNEMTYDSLGRLIKDADPAGGFTALNRQEKTGGYTITSSKASSHNRFTIRKPYPGVKRIKSIRCPMEHDCTRALL